MTNKEAIKTLKANYPDACFEQLREAVDAAIEALKAQDADSDTISRKAAIDAVYKCDDIFAGDMPVMVVKSDAYEALAQLPSAQPEPCGDVVSINAIVQKLNEMDRYVSTELRLCDTDKKFPQNEVFIVDDVYEEIVEQLPPAQPETHEERTETHACDLISRQAAIDVCNKAIDLWQGQLGEGIVIAVRKKIEELPSAQPDSKELSFTQKALDTISRQAAIDAILAVTGNSSVRELYEHVQEHGLSDMWSGGVNAAIDIIIAVPSAQPEIIRCKDCEYGEQDEVGRWFCRSLGCQIGNEDGSGYCADAERRTDDSASTT